MNNQNETTTRTTRAITSAAGSSSPKRSKSATRIFHANSFRQRHSKLKKALSRRFGKSSRSNSQSEDMNAPPANALIWMERHCPDEILCKILAYSGPQITQVLSRTNHFWNELMNQEATWKSLCEDLYKWEEGDENPQSWKDFYRFSPCVPIDYSTIPAALKVATVSAHHDAFGSPFPNVLEQRHDVRVLLRPGKYNLREPIVIHSTSKCVTIKTIKVPEPVAPPQPEPEPKEGTSSPGGRRLLKRANSFRSFMSCRAVNILNHNESEEDMNTPEDAAMTPSNRAQLILNTRRQNEPVIRVRQGRFKLYDVNIVHNSNGLDIWNGNAAIQVQPTVDAETAPVAIPEYLRPKAALERVDITSKSGRGIVNIDGGFTEIRWCYIHDCAATGIYVGGPGSHAIIENTDVLRNGNGNQNRRGGIGEGHSGIYLEQGTAAVRDCNISQNSLTGLSAVSQENAILSLEQSDLVANGSAQLEMPPDGSTARRRSLTRNNNVSSSGISRQRSGLMELN